MLCILLIGVIPGCKTGERGYALSLRYWLNTRFTTTNRIC